MFLPQKSPYSRWCLQCLSYATCHHLQTKPQCKKRCLCRLTKTAGPIKHLNTKAPRIHNALSHKTKITSLAACSWESNLSVTILIYQQHHQSFSNQAAPLLPHYSLTAETSPGQGPSGINRDSAVWFRLLMQERETTRTS